LGGIWLPHLPMSTWCTSRVIARRPCP
jgi:hypothetical protein